MRTGILETLEIRFPKWIKMRRVLTLGLKFNINSLGSAINEKVTKLKQSNKLNSVDSFVDKDQILHLVGRLKNSNLNNNFIPPILLHKTCVVTKLLMRWCYEKSEYGEIGTTLGEITNNWYWIIDAISKQNK